MSDPIYPKTPMNRFMQKVNKTKFCWLWTSAQTTKGYALFHYNRKTVYAHIWIFEQLIKLIPNGFQLDHLCRTRNCVNPDHLEIVTQQENIKRGLAGHHQKAKTKLRTHCPQNHEYLEANTGWYKGSRYCLQCRRDNAKSYYKKKKAKI